MVSDISLGLNPHGQAVRPQPLPLAAYAATDKPDRVGQADRMEPPSLDELEERAPQRVLNRQIMDALNQHLETEGKARIETLDPNDFSAQNVAARIVGFIGSALGHARAGGTDEDHLANMLAQARKGVEQGFSEARTILHDLGMLKDKVKDDVEKTHELVTKGLDRLEQADAPEAEAAFLAASFSKEHSLSLQVQTRDGDTVTLNIDSMNAARHSQQMIRNDSGALFFSEHNSHSRSSIRFSVEGELDEGEMKALQGLFSDVDKLADEFFDGQVLKVIDQAAKLGFDNGELANFSLSLSQVETRQATLAYRTVDRLGGNDERPPLPSGFAEESAALGGFLNGMRGLMQRVVQGFPFGPPDAGEPQDLARELLSQRIQVDDRFESAFADFGQDVAKTVDRTLDQLTQAAQPLPKG